jgi:CheY-like chemotaxis protein
MTRRVLIVDDDKEIITMLQYSLKSLGADYEIETALGSLEALAKIEKNAFNLVVTDYMMKDMTGVDLARAVRRLSPGTQVILMSAFGSKRLRDTSESLGLDGYLDKPFDIEKMRRIITNAVNGPDEPAKPVEPDRAEILQKVRDSLQELQVSASARCVLLLSAEGYPIQVIGQINDLQITSISAVIAANFLGTTELANLLGNRSVFRSSFHAGDDYNIYVYDVNGAFLLAVVFDARRKPGVIWFYTKQAASAIAPLLSQPTFKAASAPEK